MNDSDILTQFADDLRGVGLVVDHLNPAEKEWHHCGTVDRPNSKNGRYRFHLDPPANVSWKNRRTGEEGNFFAKGGPTLTAAEKEAQKAHRAQEKAKREQAEAEAYSKTAAQAQSIWNAAKPASPKHPYLVRKGVSVLGIRQRGELLVVPILDDSGKVLSLQYIMPEKGRYGRDKDYLKGKKKSGGFFSIPAKDGRTDGPLLICEGYATAASLHMATGYGVLVAFDTGGLKPVATVARRRYPEREIILCADNDVNTEDNPGVRYATAAAQSIGARLAICPTKEESTDFNDLYMAQGLEAVRAAVESAAPPDPSTLPESSEEDTAKPVQSSILPPPPRVPMQAFPQRIREIIEEAAEAYVVPEQVPAAALLALVSCMVGRSRAVEVKSGWREHGNIWLVIVAPSGLGKTPVANAFFKTINEMERRRHNEWKIANAAYTREWMDYNKAKPEKRGEAPEKPRRIQYYIDDSTEEALADALEQNPRGVMWKTDELSGTLASFEKYSSSGKKGGTKARLLSAYDCQVWKSGRVDAGRNLYIPAACVSIFGGMQPGMVSRCFDAEDSDSGFLPRFMFVRAEMDKPALWSDAVLSASSRATLQQIVETLDGYQLAEGENEQLRPHVVPMAPEALKAFKHWYNELAMEGWADLNSEVSAALRQKLKAHALRLGLLLHCLDAALEGSDARTPLRPDTMHRALLLADWIKVNQGQIRQLLVGDSANKARAANPIERAVMAAVVDAEAEIKAGGGKITNARLAELANERLPVAVRPEVIGKAASALGLGSCRTGGKGKQVKVRTVPPEKLETFKTATVPAVLSTESGFYDHSREQQSEPPHLPGSTGSTVPITNRTTPQARMAVGGSTGSAGSTGSSSGDGKMSPSDIAAWCQREGLEYDPATGVVGL